MNDFDEPSIMKSLKQVLGTNIDSTFDLDIAMAANSAFANLSDFGLGPVGGFRVQSEEDVWDDFFGPDLDDDLTLERAKTYVWQKVLMVFDPPGTSFHLAAKKEIIAELEGRLLQNEEVKKWSPTTQSSSLPFLL